MSELKSGWRWVRFGDVVRQAKDRVDPEADGIERYVAGEHMDSDDLRIRRWGTVGDGYLGPAFHMRFRPGHVLYGSRRTYLRKVAVADFEGVCANTTFVLESADPTVLLPELLPFVMKTEAFHSHSTRESRGSVNPYVNFSDLAWFEFELPPLVEQKRLVRLLLLAERTLQSLRVCNVSAVELYRSASLRAFCRPNPVGPSTAATSPRDWAPPEWACSPLGELTENSSPVCYGIVKLGDPVSSGIPVLRTQNLNGDYERDVYHVSKDVEESYRRSRVRAGDILVAIQGVSTGKIGMVPAGFEGNINRHLARIRLSDRLLPEYFFHLWRSAPFAAYLRSVSVGTTKPELTIGDLRRMQIPVPPRDVQVAIATELTDLENCSRAIDERVIRAEVLQREILRTAWCNT